MLQPPPFDASLTRLAPGEGSFFGVAPFVRGTWRPDVTRLLHSAALGDDAADDDHGGVRHRLDAETPDRRASPAVERARAILRVVLAVSYLLVGIFHLRATDGFAAIVPDWVPAPHAVVIATGCCELLGAVALLTRRLRRLAGIMLALYAVCVFPANINQAIKHIPIDGVVLGWGYHAPRFAFQPVLVWWALFCGGVIDWPFRGRNPR